MRTRQREHETEEGQIAQGGEPAARLDFAAPRERPEKAEAGILDGRRLSPVAAQISQQGQQKQEGQDPGMRELNLAHGRLPFCGIALSVGGSGFVAVTKVVARCCTCSSSVRVG